MNNKCCPDCESPNIAEDELECDGTFYPCMICLDCFFIWRRDDDESSSDS
jgi:hypothetical protein